MRILGVCISMEPYRIPLEFDVRSGAYIDDRDSNLRFCTRCLGNLRLATHLAWKVNGWECMLCGQNYEIVNLKGFSELPPVPKGNPKGT